MMITKGQGRFPARGDYYEHLYVRSDGRVGFLHQYGDEFRIMLPSPLHLQQQGDPLPFSEADTEIRRLMLEMP
jgi:hypothetical protein